MTTYNDILAVMTAKYTELTGLSPDSASDIGIRMKVLAAQIYSLAAQLDETKKQLFPTTATGSYLDMHAGLRGITRKGAARAQGKLKFMRETAAAYDIVVPKGTVCQTENGTVKFETTEAGTIAAGTLFCEVYAQSTEGGEAANTAAGRVTVLVSPPQGVSSVTNAAAFTGGGDGENDLELRSRLIAGYNTISNGANAAFYYTEAMKYDFVYSARVIPKVRGLGTVDVVVYGKGCALTTEQIAILQAHFDKEREICTDVDVIAATPKVVNIAVNIVPADEYSFDTVKAELEASITEFISAAAVGKPLLISDLNNRIYGFSGVYNYTVASPAADVLADADEIITAGTVTVSRLGS